MIGKQVGKRPVLAALLLGVAVLAGCDSVEERVAKHVERAEGLVAEGQLEKAILEYRNAIRLDAKNVDVLLALAKTLEEDGRFTAAVRHYITAVEHDAQNVDARVRLAQYMLVSNDIDRALEYADRAYELQPDDPDVLAVRASVAYQMENKALALRLASEAVAIEPLHAAANVVLITERVESGNLQEAMAMADAIVESEPNDLSLQLLKLRLFEMAERPEAALKQLEIIVERFTDIVTPREALAQAYARIGNNEGALEQLRAIVELEPQSVERKLDVVQFIGSTEGLEAGIAALDTLIDEAEEKWPFREAKIAALMRYDREAEAMEILNTIIAEGGEGAIESKVMIARMRLTEGDIEAGQALIDEIIAQDETNVDALAMRGALEIERDDYDAALETLRIGLAVEPEDVRLLLLSGRANLLNGNDALGADQLANATRVSDYRADVSQEYVRYLLQRGRVDGAEAVLSETARRAPTNRDVLMALAELRLRLEDWVGAETVAKQMRELDGGADMAERVLAASLTGQERFEESLSILSGLANDASSREQTMTALVQSMVAADKGADAEAFIGRVLQEDPNNFQARMLQASLAQNAGDDARARSLFESIAQDFPTSAEVYFILYRIQLAEGDTAAAKEVIERGIEATDGDLRLRMQLASIAEREGRFDDAIAQYEAVFEAEPNSLVAANNLASTLAEHRADDPEELARAKKIALRLKGTNVPHMKDTVGWTLYLAGDYGEALPYLIEAVEALPNSAVVNYHTGMTFAALGDGVKAREYLERALQLAEGTVFPHTEVVENTLSGLPALPDTQ
ncbi:MAG: tetratricopeptide repeat protein [Pseudomonadota bacterium]